MNVELKDPMNAHIVPKERAYQLSGFQKKMIVSIANSKTDPYPKRAERLKKLQFCTDECKFEVLSQSDYISKELYDCLADIYFGRVQSSRDAGEVSEPKPLDIVEYQNEKRTKDVSAQSGESISDPPADQTDSEPPEPEAPSDTPTVTAETPSDTQSDTPSDTPTETTETPSDEAQIPPAAVKRNYTKRMTEEDTIELIKLYLSGMKCPKLASRFGRTADQIKQKIADCKRKPKYKEMFEPNRTDKTTEERFEEIISSVDAGSQRQGSQPDKPEPKNKHDRADGLPKCFTACGKGFITTDGGLKLDEEPITAMLRQKIVELGLVQFWGEISIVITPGRPAGMIVSVEE